MYPIKTHKQQQNNPRLNIHRLFLLFLFDHRFRQAAPHRRSFFRCRSDDQEHQYCRCCSRYAGSRPEWRAQHDDGSELIDDEGQDISQSSLIQDAEKRPFSAAEFGAHRSDSRETRHADHIEHEERYCADRVEQRAECGSYLRLRAGCPHQYTKCAYNIFLCDQSLNGRHRRLPRAEAQWCEEHSNCTADLGQECFDRFRQSSASAS